MNHCSDCLCHYTTTEEEHKKTPTHLRIKGLQYRLEKLEKEAVVVRLKKTMEYLNDIENEMKANVELISGHIQHIMKKM